MMAKGDNVKTNISKVLIRCLTIFEKTKIMAEVISNKILECFSPGNHEEIGKRYDK